MKGEECMESLAPDFHGGHATNGLLVMLREKNINGNMSANYKGIHIYLASSFVINQNLV